MRKKAYYALFACFGLFYQDYHFIVVSFFAVLLRALPYMTSSAVLVEPWPWMRERIICAAAETKESVKTCRKPIYRANKT